MELMVERRGRSLTVVTSDRETAEDMGLVQEGRKLALYRQGGKDRFSHPWGRWGLALGPVVIELTWQGFNPDWQTEADPIEGSGERARERFQAFLAGRKAAHL